MDSILELAITVAKVDSYVEILTSLFHILGFTIGKNALKSALSKHQRVNYAVLNHRKDDVSLAITMMFIKKEVVLSKLSTRRKLVDNHHPTFGRTNHPKLSTQRRSQSRPGA